MGLFSNILGGSSAPTKLGKGVGSFVKNGLEIQWKSEKVIYQKQ